MFNSAKEAGSQGGPSRAQLVSQVPLNISDDLGDRGQDRLLERRLVVLLPGRRRARVAVELARRVADAFVQADALRVEERVAADAG